MMHGILFNGSKQVWVNVTKGLFRFLIITWYDFQVRCQPYFQRFALGVYLVRKHGWSWLQNRLRNVKNPHLNTIYMSKFSSLNKLWLQLPQVFSAVSSCCRLDIFVHLLWQFLSQIFYDYETPLEVMHKLKLWKVFGRSLIVRNVHAKS